VVTGFRCLSFSYQRKLHRWLHRWRWLTLAPPLRTRPVPVVSPGTLFLISSIHGGRTSTRKRRCWIMYKNPPILSDFWMIWIYLDWFDHELSPKWWNVQVGLASQQRISAGKLMLKSPVYPRGNHWPTIGRSNTISLHTTWYHSILVSNYH